MDGIVVFCNGARGAAVLRAIAQAGHGASRVFVPLSRTHQDAIVDACAAAGTTLEAVEDVNSASFARAFRATSTQLLLVAGFSSILREPLLSCAAHGAINLHAGRLPEYRGGSPLNWQIINGESTAGLSVIRLNQGIDTGPLLAEAEIVIGKDDTIADMHARANELFPKLTLEVLAGLDAGTLKSRTQDESRARYWHQRNDDDGRIDWSRHTAAEVHNLVRGLTRPYPGAFSELAGKRVRIFRSALPDRRIHGVPGRICYLQGDGPYVVCADCALLLLDYVLGDGDARLPQGGHLA